ncbi:MAG: hypothetical protein LT070_02070 [Solirubrobacteraceae bacterium]|nr:hypothetical protein [Solirubrobacteraceae bacterium]
MSLPARFDVAGPHLQPDRLGIWPVEKGGFGLDITYTGAAGYTRAEAVETALSANGVKCGLRQELHDGWTVRLGPVDRESMLVVLGSLVR